MDTYKVMLTRSYLVTIQANNEEDALRFSEFYIGGEKDISLPKERELDQFEIEEIEMMVNDAMEVEKAKIQN
jgi:hypothetical protein